jgi:hypothetical protein
VALTALAYPALGSITAEHNATAANNDLAGSDFMEFSSTLTDFGFRLTTEHRMKLTLR